MIGLDVPIDADTAIVDTGKVLGDVEVLELGPSPGFVSAILRGDEEGFCRQKKRLGVPIACCIFRAATGTSVAGNNGFIEEG